LHLHAGAGANLPTDNENVMALLIGILEGEPA